MMKNVIRLLSVLSFFTSFAMAEDHPEYAAKNIPQDMLLHANAVIRKYTKDMNIVSMQDLRVTEHYVITILNEKGDKYANENEEFSKLIHIASIGGYVYDQNGVVVEKIKQSDFKERPVSMMAGEFNDAKLKMYNVSYRNYPYTVEYTIETKQDYSFQLPGWEPAPDVDCSLQSAELTVTTPGNMLVKYKQYNFSDTPTLKSGNEKQYKWSVKNVPAKKREPLSYNGNYNTPVVDMALNFFMLDEYEGCAASWKEFGKFVYQINKGRDTLLPEIKEKVKELVANIKDDHEKVKVLYAYLQNTMRYVSVTYGIGGWQPLDARFLCKNQYGDCKALSNYMMALLSDAGIKSYPVLISCGNNNEYQMTRDFVCSRFTHCILCVPFAKDTTWLECTSNDLPANYLSDFTQDRDALMIIPGGGFVVHTPKYDTAVNQVTRHGNINCGAEGGLKITISSLYTGESAQNLYQELKYDNDHDKEEFLHSKFYLASYSLDDYKYRKIDTMPVTCVSEDASLTATGMYTKTGSRSFLSLDVSPIHIYIPEDDAERQNKFYIPESWAVSDTFSVNLPEKTDVEYIPAPVSLRCPFGSYSWAIVQKDARLEVVCKFMLNSGVYEAKQFQDYIKLVSLVNNKSIKKVVLKNRS